MADVTVTIGAPSLSGKDAVNEVTTAFGASSFPLNAEITNLMPRFCSFPQGKGFCLRHVADKGKNVSTCIFEDIEDLKEFASVVAQISEMNGFKDAISIKAEGTESGAEEGVGKAKVGTAKVSAAKARTK